MRQQTNRKDPTLAEASKNTPNVTSNDKNGSNGNMRDNTIVHFTQKRNVKADGLCEKKAGKKCEDLAI
jgi:hypothetical protein